MADGRAAGRKSFRQKKESARDGREQSRIDERKHRKRTSRFRAVQRIDFSGGGMHGFFKL
jgi:hypothetical protein